MSLLVMLAEAATDAHGGEAGGFPPFEPWHYPSQLFWLFVSFTGLYLILSRFILPRLSANLERRSDTIADDLDEAARLNEQAEEAQKALEQNLAKARSGARETVAKAEAEMADEIAGETRRADAELEKKLAKAETRIGELRAEAMSNVEAVATDATQAILGRFGVSASESEARAAVAGVLEE